MKPAWKNRISMTVTESQLQRACTDYLDILVNQDRVRYCVVPDGEFRRRGKGYCPDIIVWVKERIGGPESEYQHLINIYSFELKSPRGTGELTEKQSDFQAWSSGCMIDHTITNDFDEFKTIIDGALEV